MLNQTTRRNSSAWRIAVRFAILLIAVGLGSTLSFFTRADETVSLSKDHREALREQCKSESGSMTTRAFSDCKRKILKDLVGKHELVNVSKLSSSVKKQALLKCAAYIRLGLKRYDNCLHQELDDVEISESDKDEIALFGIFNHIVMPLCKSGSLIDRNQIHEDFRHNIEDRLTTAGFRIFNKNRITLDDFEPINKCLGESSLIDFTRNIVRPPIDILVLVQLPTDLMNNVWAKVRILDVRSGRVIGHIHEERSYTKKVGLLRIVNSVANKIIVRLKKDHLRRSPARRIQLIGFSQEQQMAIRRQLNLMSGGKVRLIQSNFATSIFWIESKAAVGHLKDVLYKVVVDKLRIKPVIKITLDGISIEKLRVIKQGYKN